MQQGGFRPRGRFSDDFHGRRSRGIRSGIRRVVPVLFPRHLGPDVLERLRQHRRLRFRLFQSLEGPRHLHAPVRRRSGLAVFHPRNILYSESWSGSGDYTFYAYYPVWTAAAATYSDGGVLLNIPSAQNGEFGRYQVCFSQAVTVSSEQIGLNKSVRFDFKPASSLMRVQLFLDEASSADEVYISQASVSVSGCALFGDCKLSFADGSLAASASASGTSTVTVRLTTPVRITKKADGQNPNPYIDFVILPTSNMSGIVKFSVTTQAGLTLTTPDKDVPASGFAGGTRYFIERPISVVLDDDSPDASYIDGGLAWEATVDNDGAYSDGGVAW